MEKNKPKIKKKGQFKKAIRNSNNFISEKRDQSNQVITEKKELFLTKTKELSQKGKEAYVKVQNYSEEKRDLIITKTKEQSENIKLIYSECKEIALNKYNGFKENTENFYNDSKENINRNLDNYSNKLQNSWTEIKAKITDFDLTKKQKEPEPIDLCLYWTDRIKGQGLFLPGTRLYKNIESAERYLKELKKINYKTNNHILNGISLTLEKYEELLKEPIRTEKIYQLMRKIESVIPDYTRAIHEMYDEAVGIKCTDTDIHIEALNNQLKINGYLNESFEEEN